MSTKPGELQDVPGYGHVQETFNYPATIVSGQASLSIFDPLVPWDGSHSLQQVWMYSGTGFNDFGCTCALPPTVPTAQLPACAQSVEAGWEVADQYPTSAPYLFVFGTNGGYTSASNNWVGSTPGATAPKWVPYPGNTMSVGMSLPFGTIAGTMMYQGQVGGAQHELLLFVEAIAGTGGTTNWWVGAGLDAAWGNWLGYFTGANYSGTMQTKASTFQAGGEVFDQQVESGTSTWRLPMSSTSAPTAGFGSAAYAHDVTACASGQCMNPNVDPNVGIFATVPNTFSFSPSSVTPAPAASATPSHQNWANWFYLGDAPVFWSQNYGYQWSPNGDWAPGSYKGECQTDYPGPASAFGHPITGVSAYASGQFQAHALQCGIGSTVTTPSGCYTRNFDPANSEGESYDWDPGHPKGDCAANEYVQGIAQNTSGQVDAILCCPSLGTSANHQTDCEIEPFYQQNSPGYRSPDWDPGYYKGECPNGEYVAGVSAQAPSGAKGPPHAILCCR